jgi:hypothetical protein
MNSKLKLNLDDLTVDSFDTTLSERPKGTVFGEQCTCYTNCTCPGCPTCDGTCPNTCAYTCDDVSCNGTCNCGTDNTCGYSCYHTDCGCLPPTCQQTGCGREVCCDIQ